MANLKEVPVQELLDELLSRIEREMTRLEANIEAQEHEKKRVLRELDEVLRRLASSAKQQESVDGGGAKRISKSKRTNH